MKIKCDGKEYDIPDLDADHLLKIAKREEKKGGEAVDLPLSKRLEGGIDFFYDLLNPYYPELTKKVLGKMPSYQLSDIFQLKIIVKLLTPPLDSESETSVKKESVSENSSTPATSPSPSGSAGRPKKSVG